MIKQVNNRISKPEIKIKNLSYQYENKKALRNIDLVIPQNQWLSIVGPNGSGKTTLIKLLLNLIEMQSGSINLEEQKITAVFQNPDEQFFGNTVEDDLAFVLENQQLDSKTIQKKVSEQLKKFNLTDIAKSNPQSLSGGQKQRVAIASALISDADILVLDEITSMLDPESKNNVIAEIQKIHSDNKTTIISITHDADEALKSQRTILLKDGEILADDKPSKILLNSKIVETYKLPVSRILQYKRAFKNKIPKKIIELLNK